MSRLSSIAFLLVGAFLMFILAASLLKSRSHEGSHVGRVLLTHNSDFIIANSLSPDRQQEARSLFESAQKLADRHAFEATRANRWGYYLQWASFFFSSLIVVIAGYYGRVPSDQTAESIAKDLRAASPPKEDKRRKRSYGRFASIVGMIAALSAISNGAATRLQASALQSRQEEQVVSDAVIKTSKVTAQPTAEADVDAALEDLRRVLRDNDL